MNLDTMPDLLKHKEVAAYFRINSMTLYRWVKKGLITPLHINSRGDKRYPKEEVQRLKRSFKI